MAKEKEDSSKNSKLSKPLQEIIDKIEKLTVLELSELVTALEEKFGVTAQAPVATAPATAPAEGDSAAVEEKTEFNVVLTAVGDKKIEVIKALREIKPDLGLKEAKDLTESTPQVVLESAKKEAAEEAKAKLEAAGASVELK